MPQLPWSHANRCTPRVFVRVKRTHLIKAHLHAAARVLCAALSSLLRFVHHILPWVWYAANGDASLVRCKQSGIHRLALRQIRGHAQATSPQNHKPPYTNNHSQRAKSHGAKSQRQSSTELQSELFMIQIGERREGQHRRSRVHEFYFGKKIRGALGQKMLDEC